MKNLILSGLLLFGAITYNFAQCPAGQVNITVDVITDDWGYECFWDLTPAGNGCGVGALFTFGNVGEVSCLTGGSQVATSGGYADNALTTETIGCLTIGTCYDINYVDDYGDGGAIFVVRSNGVVINTFESADTTITATYSFCAIVPPVFDAKLSVSGFKYSLLPKSQAASMINPASIESAGSGTITGAKIDVTVTQGATTLYSASSPTQTIASLASANFAVPAFTPTSAGIYNVNYLATITETDEVPSNNNETYSVNVSDSVYAVDDDISLGLLGLGAGELGYIGTSYEIVQAVQATSLSAYLGNGGGSFTDSTFKVHIFSTDTAGTPLNIIATAQGVIENVAEQWYTINLPSGTILNPGKYVVALEENTYQQELGASEVYFPETSWIYTATQIPWTPIEDLGFPITMMLRLNLATSALGISELETTELTVYPNPTNDQVHLTGLSANSSLQIYNDMGQLVKEETVTQSNWTVSLSDLKPGIYILKNTGSSQIGMARIVKQ